jgi:DNA-binding NtrC family response regulator
MSPGLLLIENGPDFLESSWMRRLDARGCCQRLSWDNFSPEALQESRLHLIVANAVPGESKAALFFQWLRENPIPIPTLAILAESVGKELLGTVMEVTDDFAFWPVSEEEIDLRISRILGSQFWGPEFWRREQIESNLEREAGLASLVGQHAAFLQVVQQVPIFAASHAPVLITGETGTGKELFAHAIHSLSARSGGPFIPIDCGTLPEQLAENELFGHCRGAFTDAHTEQKGLIALAEGGTVFLDEIDALSLTNQSKLLRFLQDRVYRSLGATHFHRADVRVIAATNRVIEESVHQGEFRSDLYFRLNVLRLLLPPLRERHGDTALLAQSFLENECKAAKSGKKQFSSAAMRKLERHCWPGNVRELFNTVQRAFVCCRGHHILPEHITLNSNTSYSPKPALGRDNFQSAKQEAIENFERTYLEELLVHHQGNITRAARAAGKERRAFGKLVKKYGISAPQSS